MIMPGKVPLESLMSHQFWTGNHTFVVLVEAIVLKLEIEYTPKRNVCGS